MNNLSITIMENITVEEFINDYLIKQIGKVRKDYPYFAFLLMAVGIEFLGKCQNSQTAWQTRGLSESDFKLGMTLFPQNYQNMDLFGDLRCGMAHTFCPDKCLRLSNGSGQGSSTLSCDDFYYDFKAACDKLILSGAVLMPTKKLTDIFLTVQSDANGNTNTGDTSTTADTTT